MQYLIEIKETLFKMVEVEANSELEAFELVEKEYKAGKHELDYNYYANTEFLLG